MSIKILGIESSCDETAASVSLDGRTILSNIVASQVEEHKKFGGVVPEIASRRHSENILAVVKAALDGAGCGLSDIDGIAVTYAPGLIGALLVGTSFAKGLAHPELEPPYLCLVASGGHSQITEVLGYTKFRVIGRTRDDAAGEAFDKCARVLGYPYPGGVHIDRAAGKGDPDKYKLPIPKVTGSEFDFSFSGLKTAVINLAHNAEQKGESLDSDSLAASFQKTAAEMLVSRTVMAAKALGYKTVAVAGGVSANSGVRELMLHECGKRGIKVFLPPLELCGDNGAMIACQGYYDFLDGKRADESLNAVATLSLEDI